jgi:PPOX class probable F420-dependent enzyme
MGSLGGARYLNLATFRKSGVAVETPIWFAESHGRLYAFSAGNAGKIKRLRRSSQARVAACDMSGRVTGPWLEARARVITDASLGARALAALRAKYGWQMRMADLFSTLSGRIHKRALIEIELRDA